MSESKPKQEQRFQPLDSTTDVELASVLDRYLDDRRRGVAPLREEFLAQYPQFAERLAACLEGIDLMGDGRIGKPDVTAARLPEPPMPDIIGDYEILSELGRGGMGVVYAARERKLDRVVALKVMRFGIVDPRALERFQREAETAGALHHTNIVPVYATGRQGDTSWYAMQRIDGDSLAQWIEVAYRGESPKAIEIAMILDVGIQAAEALGHAHDRDVVHRDVKPANLIVDREGRVWLTDFGLARRLVDVGATMTGAMLGTPRYMSPEQADLSRDVVDHRSDIYSLGATLYELATGRPPFRGDDPLRVISQIRYDEPPSIRSLRSDLPNDLEVVLAKSMNKDPARRYDTAAELADELRAIRDDRPIQARAITPVERLVRWTRKHRQGVRLSAAVVLATVALMVVSGLGWKTWHESTLGTFRLRAAGGPYLTRVHRAGESATEANAIEMTVPTEHPQRLPRGDYDLMLAPHGRWSKQIRLPVTGGMASEFRLRGAPEQSKSISIGDAWVSVVEPAARTEDDRLSLDPAVLWRYGGQLRRHTPDSTGDWTLDVRGVSATRISLRDDLESESDEKVSINFANTQSSTTFSPSRPRGNAMLDHASMISVPATALRTAIDLDGDDKGDSVIAALDQPAMLAVDAKGNVLWARVYDINGKSLDPSANNTSSADEAFPGVIDLIDIGDSNDDGTSDLLVSLVQIQPGVANDLCIAVISGNTGEAIRVLHRESLTVIAAADWPSDGVFHTYDSNKRQLSGLRFSTHGVRRIHASRNFADAVRWQGTSSPTFALPSPIHVTQDDGKRIAVYQVGDRCLRFDIDSGQAVGSSLTLPFVPALRPTIAHSEGKAVLLFSNFDSSRSAIGTLAFDIAGNQLWQRPLISGIHSVTVGLRNRPDWPLAGDVDGDGNDELLMPGGTGYRNPGVEMFNAWTGKSSRNTEFRTDQFYQSAEFYVSRMALSSDIDGDGFRDWVTASIAGPPHPTADNRVASVGEAYVYIDWISGNDGSSLAWSRYRVPLVSDKISVAEIEAIRCDIPGGEAGAVEVEFVTGDSELEDELDSMILRFHPSCSEPTAIAAGLTVCAQSGGLHRVCQMRPGPYADGPHRLVFLSEPDTGDFRIGEQETVAAWKDSVGRDLLAVTGFEPPRLSVIDTANLSTLWATERAPSHFAKFASYTHGNGRVDFLLQPGIKQNEPAQLIEGETGRVCWTMSAPPGGYLKVANRVTDDWMMVIADGNYQREQGSKLPPPSSFQMSMVNLRSGSVRWSQEFLDGATRHNYPKNFDDLQYADLNGDGFPDVVGPEQGSDERLMLAAWDGMTGEKMWQRSLGLKGFRTDYFVEFCILPGEKPRVAFYGKPDEGQQTPLVLIVCDGKTGEVLIEHDLGETISQQISDRTYRQKSLRLTNATTDAGQQTIGLLAPLKDSPECAWLLFDVRADGLLEREAAGTELPGRGDVDSIWTHVRDSDAVAEYFVSQRFGGAQGLDRNGDFYHQPPRTTFACYDSQSNEPKWEISIDDPVGRYAQIRNVFWTQYGDAALAWLELDRRFVLVDLEAGQIVGEVNSDLRPRVVKSRVLDADVKSLSVRVAIPTADGVTLRWLGNGQESVSLAGIHHQPDPRRIRPLLAVGVPPSTDEWFSSVVKSLVSAVFLCVVPLWYVGTMIRRRRWSLSWMLLAAPVVMLALTVWSTAWMRQPSIYWNVIQGIGWLSVFVALYVSLTKRTRADVFAGFSWALVFGFAILIAGFIAAFSVIRAVGAPDLHYVITTSGLVSLSIGSVCTGCHLYWGVRLIRSAVNGLAHRRTQ